MKTNEIRDRFLKFFAAKNHTVVPSSSLVPENDPTLLFCNAGMNQFKDVFLGKEKKDYCRATSSQKCVRAGGKHNDLENVGFTARHHTFFEMLGNFSFGDYFKQQAIAYAWEFVTKELKLPLDKIYVTVYKDDDEAYKIWTEVQGIEKSRIFRLGDKDNFWQMGDTGPCGPCTELFVDRGPKYCNQEHGKCIETDHDCDRYIEFWNLVFMQYDRAADGTLTPLPKPSVDTGAGLERIASILQDVDSNYDIDSFREIISEIEKVSRKKYVLGTPEQAYFRVVADHARAVAFLISDGVIPANEGRGYVLRRIIRRAIRYGRELGLKEPFLNKICIFVLKQMGEIYPELKDKESFVRKCVIAEEEQFLRTLEKGLQLLDEELATVKNGSLNGEVAFKLYDTYGFPIDLTVLIARERGVGVDEKGFEKAMDRQKSQSRKSRKGGVETGVEEVYHHLFSKLKSSNTLPTFTGYDAHKAKTKCIGLISDEHQIVQRVTCEQGQDVECEAVFAECPFYPEGGGQIADLGVITASGMKAKVTDVRKPVEGLIIVSLKILEGEIAIDSPYELQVDTERRSFIKRNHTATHLLHGALRTVLGDHVKQAGSLVTDEMLRFDFTHFNSMTREEMTKVEEMVLQEIWKSYPVKSEVTSKDEAVKAGAIAFFGEKYGDEVRVIKAGSYSVELCGGIHVSNTSDIQAFKIASEGAIAAGVRRIIGLTSKAALTLLNERYDETRSVREILKAANAGETVTKLERLLENEKELKKKVESFKSEQMNRDLQKHITAARSFEGGKLISFICPKDDSGIKFLRTMSDQIRAQVSDSVVILGMADDQSQKVFILAAVGKDAKPTVTADQIIREIAPMIAGRGGGKPDLAQAGGDKLSALNQAMKTAEDLVLQN